MKLKTTALSVGYAHKDGECALLEDLHIEANGAELIALLGANGTGKSTLLRTLCGLQTSLAGKILFDENDSSGFSARDWAVHSGLVLPHSPETGNLDVYGLVALGRTPFLGVLGRLQENDHEVIARSLEEMDLTGFASRKVKELSDGERQRVMIARALAQETPFVFMDEPTAFLDLRNRKRMMRKLKELCAGGTRSFILSTHEADLALQYADRFWIIGSGRTFYDIRSYSEAEAILKKEFDSEEE